MRININNVRPATVMSFAKVISVVFNLLGALLCLLAIIAGGISATALVERIQHGRGIMFADVEFFALTALALLVPGLALLMVARHLTRRVSREKSEKTV
jgi:hypothetical protein